MFFSKSPSGEAVPSTRTRKSLEPYDFSSSISLSSSTVLAESDVSTSLFTSNVSLRLRGTVENCDSASTLKSVMSSWAEATEKSRNLNGRKARQEPVPSPPLL